MSDTKLLQAIANRITLIDKKIDNGFKEVKEELKKLIPDWILKVHL